MVVQHDCTKGQKGRVRQVTVVHRTVSKHCELVVRARQRHTCTSNKEKQSIYSTCLCTSSLAQAQAEVVSNVVL